MLVGAAVQIEVVEPIPLAMQRSVHHRTRQEEATVRLEATAKTANRSTRASTRVNLAEATQGVTEVASKEAAFTREDEVALRHSHPARAKMEAGRLVQDKTCSASSEHCVTKRPMTKLLWSQKATAARSVFPTLVMQ